MKSIFKNSIFKAILQICNIVIPVVIGMIVMRILNRTYVDQYNAVDSFFQLFLTLGAFGIYNYGVREASKVRDDKEKLNQLFTQLYTISLITNAIAIGAYVAFAFGMYQNGEPDSYKFIISFIVMIQFVGNIFNVEWLNEANEKYAFISIKSILVRVLYLVLAVLLVKQETDIVLYVSILSGTAALNMLLSFLYVKRKHKFDFRGFNLKKHIVPVISVCIIANIALLYSQLSKLFLSSTGVFKIDEAEITSFTVALHISSMVYSVLISVVTTTIPRLSNMHGKGNDEEAMALHQKIVNIFMCLFLPATVGLILLSEQIVVLYGGEQYANVCDSLMIACASQVISGLHYIYGEAYIYVMGKEKTLLWHNAVGAGINLVLSLVLALVGIYTSVIAYACLTAAYIVITSLDIIFLRRKLGYKSIFLNKHVVLYALVSCLFIPVILLSKKPFFNVWNAEPTFFFTVFSVAICVVLYFAIVYFVEVKFYKNSFLTTIIGKIKNKFSKDKKAE